MKAGGAGRSRTFVLVPGAWHGGWCFGPVARRLRRAGHDVHSLTLTGLGERAHLAHAGIDLDTHIRDVVGVLDAEELTDVVLLGHSYGGCVISGVAQKRPDAIGTLVYLDAIVLADGECLFDQLDPNFQAALDTDAAENGDGYLLSIPTREFLGIDAEHWPWVARRLTPHPIATAKQPLATATPPAAIRRVFIDCNQPSIPPLAVTKQRLASASGWSIARLATGHDPFVTATSELSDMLAKVASERTMSKESS